MDEIPIDSGETQRLLEQVRSGKSEVFEELFKRYRSYLRQIIDMRLDPKLRKRLDASDIVQETQMEANRRLMEYLEKEPVSFHVWLRQIARDQLLMARRHHVDAAQRAVTREVQLPERSALQLAEKLITDGSTPSQHLAKKEQAQRIREGLNKLSDMDREILLMRNLEQLTYKDISYLLEIEPAAAKMRHGRALIRLGKILHTNGLTESQI